MPSNEYKIDDEITYIIDDQNIFKSTNHKRNKFKTGGGILDSPHITKIVIKYKAKSLKTILEELALISINKAITSLNSIRLKNGSRIVDQSVPLFANNNIEVIETEVNKVKAYFFRNIFFSSFGYLYFKNNSEMNIKSLQALIKDIRLLKEKDNFEFENDEHLTKIKLTSILHKVIFDIYFDKKLLEKFFSSLDPLKDDLKAADLNKKMFLNQLLEKIIYIEEPKTNIGYLASIIRFVINKELGVKIPFKSSSNIQINNWNDEDLAYLDVCVTFINYITSSQNTSCCVQLSDNINDPISLLNFIESINQVCVYGYGGQFEDVSDSEIDSDSDISTESVCKKYFKPNSLVFKARHVRLILLYFDNGNDLIKKGLEILSTYEKIATVTEEQKRIFRDNLFNYIAFDDKINILSNDQVQKQLLELSYLKNEKPLYNSGGKIVRKYLPGVYKCNDNRNRRAFRIIGRGNTLFVLSNNQITKKNDIKLSNRNIK